MRRIIVNSRYPALVRACLTNKHTNSVSYSSIAVVKHYEQDDLYKDAFMWFMVPER